MEALGGQLDGEEGGGSWRCPGLTDLWLGFPDAPVAVARMLEKRYSPRNGGDRTAPQALSSITFIKYHPSEETLAHISTLTTAEIRLLPEDPATVSPVGVSKMMDAALTSLPSLSVHAALNSSAVRSRTGWRPDPQQ